MIGLGLLRRWRDRIAKRPPDFIIGSGADSYLNRWYVVPRNAVANLYLHQFVRSDDDRALHDHPWINASLLIEGSYIEHTPRGAQRYVAGDIKCRRAVAAHRVELDAGPCWSFFLTGPRIRDWGFHCRKGWVHWRIFTNPADRDATVGRGCGDGEP